MYATPKLKAKIWIFFRLPKFIILLLTLSNRLQKHDKNKPEMRRIYTRIGDTGTTAINGGERVAKTDARIEALGALDELNTAIGTARAFMSPEHPHQAILQQTQITLMSVMSRVATPSCRRATNNNTLPATLIDDTEKIIDAVTAATGDATHFLLPGGSPVSAFLHQARVAARRAERRLWRLNQADEVESQVMCYINRLADLFFTLARAALAESELNEEQWQKFSHNRQQRT